ncbi:uncharacterized protein N7483_012116 [Penicillium malachiteum]|uniref:uncharacterized protein n=1 Tax=Penicillium malachiteum TaxID=1324776 RepID=UPI0025485789|nr:uncharacterized protein N7483_012116 [Penicillium malachiteum]KAJ5714935.1 hypothetical protein N7483_012116 [Penicillium malachiteum]
MTNFDAQVDGQTKEALKADLTLWCLIKTKYEPSAIVIAWAQSLAETLSAGILQNVEQQTSGFSVELNMIQMFQTRTLLISLDLFLNECDKELRSNIHNNFDLKRPVYQIAQRGTSCFVFRNPKADAEVTDEYIGFSNWDKGPRPFFSDLRNPPLYVDGTRREGLQHLLLPYDWRKPTERRREVAGSPRNEEISGVRRTVREGGLK